MLQATVKVLFGQSALSFLGLLLQAVKLTHGGDGVGRGALVVGEPQRHLLGGGENDEGLGHGAEGLAQHHHGEQVTRAQQRPTETQHGAEHVEPRAQNQLQGKPRGQRSIWPTRWDGAVRRWQEP